MKRDRDGKSAKGVTAYSAVVVNDHMYPRPDIVFDPKGVIERWDRVTYEWDPLRTLSCCFNRGSKRCVGVLQVRASSQEEQSVEANDTHFPGGSTALSLFERLHVVSV